MAISEEGGIFILQSRASSFPQEQAGSGGRAGESCSQEGYALRRDGAWAGSKSCIRPVILKHGANCRANRASWFLPRACRMRPALSPTLKAWWSISATPADHLACVAREYSRPMLTGAGKATQTLRDGQWVILDAGHGHGPESA